MSKWVKMQAMGRVLAGGVVAGVLLVSGGLQAHAGQGTGKTTSAAVPAKHHPSKHQASAQGTGKHGKTVSARHKRTRRKPRSAKSIARSRKLQRAFVASSQLRPMAQELVSMRTPAAYAGVASYAHSHPGEAASAAYLALGHAYLLDHRYPEAVASFAKADASGKALDDYADFLTAQADMQSGKLADAEARLGGFAQKYPDSIFVANLPVMVANLSLQQGDPQTAMRVLREHAAEPIAAHSDYQFALARANQLSGNTDEAARLYRHIFLGFPLSSEAQGAKSQLALIGAAAPLTVQERRAHADALYSAGRFSDAAEEYRSLASDPADSDPALRNGLLVAAAACDLKTKRLTKEEAEALPDSSDESGARRLYLLMELARNRDDLDAQRNTVAQMEQRFPASEWLAEALYSSGNMYLLRKDYPAAVTYYGKLATLFPQHRYAPSSHWKATWLNYRMGNYSEAARLCDEQIAVYAGGREIPAALYWRGRIYQDQENRPDMAAAYYDAVMRAYQHYYYAQVARERMATLHDAKPADVAMLDKIQPEKIPELTDDVPEDDEHVVKAKLLANAGLNEYISAEIQAGDGSDEWGSFAEAEIYASYGETFRAMHVLKRAIPFYASAPIDAIPLGYWKILFPQPWWSTIQDAAARNGLSPYMVASLIRQESEFNPGAISNKSAYGLMQLLPSVGKAMAREEGIHHFNADALLNPNTNIRLGTRYLKQTIEKFGGQPEYAFAAYNAGDDRVTDWQSIGSYHGMEEFVESIPFTETREYVQAILRNESIYRELNERQTASAVSSTATQP